MFAFMAHTENEEEDDNVTLLDMKNDLNNYSLKKLRTLANVMIDSVIELTSERDIMNDELDSLTENKVKLEEKMPKMVSLESDNTELKKQFNQIAEEAEKLNGSSNGLQDETEEILKTTKKNLGLSLEKSNELEKEIVKLKEELEKSLKWTKSSKLLSNATNQSNLDQKGLGWRVFQLENSHETLSNYAERQKLSKERPGPPKPVSIDRFSKKKFVSDPMSFASERSSSQCWYMDSGCSKHMTGDIKNFLSLKTLQGGGVSFGDGKKGYILGFGKVGRLGNVSSSLLSKLISKDLVRGLPKLKFAENKICEAYVKGKQIRSSFKPKKQVTSSRVLELLHMDLCGPLKVQSRNGK
ncbi:uncharacterized protein [Solanum lycopersicum]|uniref:uncharacterized protein n=1 Tax=Solanum lycopersicum TaxID=4081 RepID=UPI0037499B59